MGDNVVHITDLGLQAANNASAGGILVNIASFKIGDGDTTHQDTDTDISGSLLHQGSIHLIEVMDKHSVRFTFEVPAHVIPSGGVIAKEVALYLDNNIMFGRCVFGSPYDLVEGERYVLSAVLVTTRCDLTTINVSLGDYTSIPSTPNVHRLGSPSESEYNAISVLDQHDNNDGSTSAGVALKFGAGSMQWAFSGFDRLYSGVPDAGATTTSFSVNVLTSSTTFVDGEVIIVYVVSGPAAGQARKFQFVNSTTSFVEKDGEALNAFDTSSTIVVWRRIKGAGAPGSLLPSLTNIPPDWVLTRGVSNAPVWAPPKTGGGNLNTLYQAPGKLRLTARNDVGDGSIARYSLGGTLLRDVNHCMPAVGGITQHKSAFDLSSGEIIFADNIPANAPIDLRLVTKEPGNGTYVDVITDHFLADGARVSFRLDSPVESGVYCFVYIRGVRQATSAYTYDVATQSIVFTTPIPEGLDVEVSSLVLRELEGYSTRFVSTSIITVGTTLFVELPVAPQTKDQTFVSVSGTHIHRDKYTMVDNQIIFSSGVRGGLEIEVSILHNELSKGTPQSNLSGVVVDAVLTNKSLKLLRHDAYPIVLPIPGVNLTSGSGIKITGQHPDYRIENTHAQQFTTATNFKFSTKRKQENTEEIIYTYRIDLTDDIMLSVSADFTARLGPGFSSVRGLEVMQYVIGFRTTSAKEPDYGRDIRGTGVAGFSSLLSDNSNATAYSNASLTQVLDIVKANIPSGYLDVVVKMRVRNANISLYGSKLDIDFNIIGTPKLT
jgi:hypothetical protein